MALEGGVRLSWAIGIDFGTSRSAGALGELAPGAGAGRVDFGSTVVSPLEIEGNRWVASMVLRTVEGELVLGTAADNLAGVHPDRVERTPKRSLGTGAPILLGGEPVDARDVAAAVIRMIVTEGRLRSGGTAPDHSVLTHPVRWADVRRAALREAGERAGLGDVQLIEEPVAAAIHYAAEHVPVGAHVGIYDLGGGTFDTAILQRTDGGFEVVGVPGGDEHIGGENFDHRVFRYFGTCLAETAPELWEQMLTSDDRKWKRAALDLLTQARRAKEALSSYTSTQVFVPVADRDIVINRSQFEAMIIDDIERTVDLMEDTVVDAGLSIDNLHSVFLVGGSSRVPLVSQMVGERFGARVVTRDEPKAVVALGAARLAALRLLPKQVPSTAPAVTAPSAPPTPVPTAAPMSPPAAGKPLDWLDRLPPPRTEQRLDAPVEPARAPEPALAREPLRPPAPLAPPQPVAAPLPAPAAVVNVAWRVALTQVPGQLAADLNGVAFGDRDGLVRLVDPRSGELRWKQLIGGGVWAAPAITDDLVVIGTLDGRVVALDRATGAGRWSHSSGAAVTGAPIVVGGTVVVANDAGRVMGLDRASGVQRWELPVAAAVRSDLCAAGRIAIVATVAGQVFGVDTETGACGWGYRTAGAITDSVAVVGDMALVPCRNGIVYGLRVSDGTAVYGVQCTGPCITAVFTAVGAFAVIDEAGMLRAHRADNGQVLSEMPVGGAQVAGAVLVPYAAPTLVVVETGAGQLVAFDLATGAAKFSVATGDGNRSRPVLSGGLVVVTTTFGQLYAIVP
jgi:outer membrane protein assembly factor BamB/actin-like ATPase involved in cell morphogenesis